METDYSFEAGGKEYHQKYLTASDALRLYSKVTKLGFVPMAQALAQTAGEGSLTDLLSTENEELGGTLLAALYEIVQTLEPEDVEQLLQLFSKVTWIETSDGSTKVRLDSLKNHFADARDMMRMFQFIWKSGKAQLDPFLDALRTGLGRAQ